MIIARRSTVEMPLTVIDHIADLQKCHSVDDIIGFSEQLDASILNDERYTRAVASRLREIHEKPKARVAA